MSQKNDKKSYTVKLTNDFYKSERGRWDDEERADDPIELYAPQVAGWKKGYYTERDFDGASGSFFMDGDDLHFVLMKTFGGYKGGDKFTERVLDVKLDPISVKRLLEYLEENRDDGQEI